MSARRGILLLGLLACAVFARAQDGPGVGAILVKGGTVKDAAGKKALVRKRFFLFPGTIKDNQAVVDRIKSVELTSRDCYYTSINASACFIKWLERENCESPLCKQVGDGDVKTVKEFEAAYDKGLSGYNRRPDLALSWIVDNLSPDLVSGFYRKQKTAVEQILGGQKPLQTIITTGTDAEGLFIDVPVPDKTAKYMISNIIPVEIGPKSFVWTCNVTATRDSQKAIVLNKTNCEITERDLKKCSTGTCDNK